MTRRSLKRRLKTLPSSFSRPQKPDASASAGRLDAPRHGPPSRETGPAVRLDAFLPSLADLYIDLTDPLTDRAHKGSVSHIIRSSFNQYADFFAEHWQLDGCYVTTAWQRRGAGALPLGWGVQQPGAEGAPVCMKASPDGDAAL
jgi:hypothetical protein